MQTQKGSANIVAFIVLLLTLGGAVWYFKSFHSDTEMATDTSSWQTYKNEKYHYEIKYPPGTNIKEPTQNERNLNVLTLGGTIIIEQLRDDGTVSRSDFLAKDFQQAVDYLQKEYPKGIDTESKTTFNGYDALLRRGADGMENIFVFHKPYTVHIGYNTKDPEGVNDKNILATFKFTK